MKQERKERLLFDVVSGIDQALIDEAATAPARSVSVILRRVVAAAAALAILVGCWLFWPVDEDSYVTAPGLLTIRVYATDIESGEVEEQYLDTATFFGKGPQVSMLNNLYPGIPLFLSADMEGFPTEKIEFDINVSSGVYITGKIGEELPKQFTISNYGEVYWTFTGWSTQLEDGRTYADVVFSSEFDHVFTKIIIRCEGHIIGYAVFDFDRIYSDEVTSIKGNMPLERFWVNLVDAASFPKVDGEYQNITEDYVNECVEKAQWK